MWLWMMGAAVADPLAAAHAADSAHATHQGGLALSGGGAVLFGVGSLWFATEGTLQALRGERATAGVPFLVGGAAVMGLGMGVAAVGPAVGVLRVQQAGVEVTLVPGWVGVGLWGSGASVAVLGLVGPPDLRASRVLSGFGAMGVAGLLGAIQDDLNRDSADLEAGRTWTLRCVPTGPGVACRW